jgi:uncharacterized lipoprotein YbaY
MKHLFTLVAASLVALLLVGCGEENPKPVVVVPVESTKTVEVAPAAQPAAPADAAPAAAKPAPAETH